MISQFSKIKRILFSRKPSQGVNIVSSVGDGGEDTIAQDNPMNAAGQFDTVNTNTPQKASKLGSVKAQYNIGQTVKHRIFPFRGVVFDVDPYFSNSDEWYEAIPEEVRPSKNQPYYHLLAENDKTHYVAYVSEQNLRADDDLRPVEHPEIEEVLGRKIGGGYEIHPTLKN